MAMRAADAEGAAQPERATSSEKRARKDVPGNFSYTNSPGRFKDALQAMIGAERPAVFNRDFIETVLNVKGGSVSGFPPIMKRLGFLGSDNSPTELYGQFQSDSSRSSAAFAGLKNGFGELFKRNAHAHKAGDPKIKDYLVQITGRTKDDPIVSSIIGTFNAVKSFVTEDTETVDDKKEVPEKKTPIETPHSELKPNLGLSYHINIVLPETKDISVFNAIFQSLKQNLLR